MPRACGGFSGGRNGLWRGARTWPKSRRGRSQRRSSTGNEDYELWVKRGGMDIGKCMEIQTIFCQRQTNLMTTLVVGTLIQLEVTAYARGTTSRSFLSTRVCETLGKLNNKFWPAILREVKQRISNVQLSAMSCHFAIHMLIHLLHPSSVL